MDEKNLFKDFSKYVFLNIFGQIAFSCYTLMDTYFVSVKLGADGLAALNIAFPIFCLLNGLGLMYGIGGGIKYAICKSRNSEKRANRIFTSALLLALVTGIIFFIIGLSFSEKLVIFLGADNNIFDITNTYLKVMLLFAPAFLLNNIMQAFVRNDKNPRLSMIAMISGSISNVILDYIFIFPLDMGIFGAIFATGLAPIISMLIIMPYILKRKNGFHFIKMKVDVESILEIISKGFTAFITEATSGIVMFVFNLLILGISGNLGLAAFGIISVISLVVIAIYTGLSQGIQPIISHYYGKNDKEKVEKIFKYGLLTQMFISLIIYITIYFGRDLFASFYNEEGNIILQRYASEGLVLYFLACPFIGINIVTSTFFASTEKVKLSQIISLSRGAIVLVPVAILMAKSFKLNGVWLSYPISEILVSLISLFLIWKNLIKNK
ncbi:MATE family efflux transporter [Anaerococcus hydrogenalis]|uniref:Multidrug export protein MepA n=1 Tax=Anaerococcus hydrogenalis TaxID=33029 RepID=A0A2N6UKU2_9FIRM|nr:MATE family efflux transporter [Anaerococcus hydrogenalis]MDK7694382.1 MATE family efflux transporter [Anaerococcus hydrogenalis]MDK7696160.1 MATE family efflux transporter [Anaerococcus hydrogenalis]MDK7707409.1 MATE family efflux transporter [Anaerococcus hydrogenalis]PMC82425.1 MATE family efflux transporter [Anaerococcus hydrogenalis]